MTWSLWSTSGSRRPLANTPWCLDAKSHSSVVRLTLTQILCCIPVLHSSREFCSRHVKRRHTEMRLEMLFKICTLAMIMGLWIQLAFEVPSLILYSFIMHAYSDGKWEWIPAGGKDSSEQISWTEPNSRFFILSWLWDWFAGTGLVQWGRRHYSHTSVSPVLGVPFLPSLHFSKPSWEG